MRPSLRVFAPNDAADFEPSEYKPSKPRLVEYCGGEWIPHCRARAARRQALTLVLAAIAALLLIAAFATHSFGGVEVDAGGRTIRKPDLYIYVNPTNEQCQALEADLEGDRDFSDALRAKYSVHIYDYDRFRFNAAIAGVKSLPAFFAPGQRWEGYRGKVDVAERLKLRWAPPVQVPPGVVDPPPPQRPLAEQLPQQPQVTPAALEAIYDRWTRHERRIASIDEFVARMAVRIRSIEEQNPEAIDELRAEVKKLLQAHPKAKDLDALRAQVKLRIEQVAGEGAADVAAEKAKEVAHAAFEEFKEQILAHAGQEGPREINWPGILAAATTALGWTGPPSIAVYGIARALIFLFKHRGAILPDPVAPPPAADGTIAASPAIDGVAALRSDLARYAGLILNRQQLAPPTQVFTPVETQLYAEAVSWAKDQLVRRYPGAQGNIEQLNSLIEQFLSQPQAKA